MIIMVCLTLQTEHVILVLKSSIRRSAMKYCHKCGTEWKGDGQPGRRETCAMCSADLHACLNCDFYDMTKPSQCRVPDVDLVRDKEVTNFCDEFRFRESSGPPRVDGTGKADMKDLWNKLFKK
jgi:hypothetical protein